MSRVRLLMVLILLFWPIFNCGAAEKSAAPHLVVEQPDFDFGKTWSGVKVEHSFILQNDGDAPLVIDRVRSSCGCTVALVSDREILPGGSAELTTTFDPARFHGNVVKTLYVYSNDPQFKVMQLYLRGKVIDAIQADPSRVDLGRIPVGQAQDYTVVLTNQSGEELTFLPPKTSQEEIRATIEPQTLAPGATAQMHLNIKPPEGRNRLNAFVVINSTSQRAAELRIPIFAIINRAEAAQ